MKPIRVGIQLHPQQGPYDGLRRAVARAEELGADIVYNWDHFYPLYGDPDGPHFECWSMLGAWAEQTSTIEFGALVTCNSYRNPQLLADMARTIDHIAGGRLVLGIGSGWFRRDYDEFGYEFGTNATRGRDLAEALPLIKERWAKSNPKPTRDIPILIAGTGPKITLKLVAQYADAWHARFPSHPDELAESVETLEKWCKEFGRDPKEIEWGLGLGPSNTDLVEMLEQHADAFVEMGFTEFTLGRNGPDWELGREVEDWLAWRDQKNAS